MRPAPAVSVGCVVGEAVGQLGHQRVAVGRDAVDAVARVAQRVQQLDRRRRRVEPDGVAEPAALGRVRRQHDGDALVGRRRGGAGAAVAHGEAGEPRDALGIGAVATIGRRRAPPPSSTTSLNANAGADDAPVELGDRRRPWRRRAGRGRRRRRATPARDRLRRRRLDHRDAERRRGAGTAQPSPSASIVPAASVEVMTDVDAVLAAQLEGRTRPSASGRSE